MNSTIIFVIFFLALSASSAIALILVLRQNCILPYRMMGDYWPYMLLGFGGLSLLTFIGAISLMTGG